MADNASQKLELLDATFLTYFNHTYPQVHSWQMPPLEQKRLSKITLHLLCWKCNKVSPINEAKPQSNIGPSGKIFVTISDLIPGYPDAPIPYPSYKSSCKESVMDNSRRPATRTQFNTLRTSYVPWATRFPHWGPQVHINSQAQENLTSA
jgi:hypothetical protein